MLKPFDYNPEFDDLDYEKEFELLTQYLFDLRFFFGSRLLLASIIRVLGSLVFEDRSINDKRSAK